MVSIIIAAKNEERLIGVLLDSLKKQDIAKEIEVVVADAFSTDKTKEIVLSYINDFKRVVVVEGGMPWTGRNLGAKASTGDLLFFIDADLVIPDIYFVSKIEHIFKTKKLAIASVYLKPLSERVVDNIIVGLYNIILYLAQFFRPLGAMCIISTRDAFIQSGGYPEDVVMAEDHDFILNASKIGSYGVIPLSASFSVRRLDKEGRWGLIYKYLLATKHRVIYGPIKKPIFDYEFEYTEESNQDKKI